MKKLPAPIFEHYDNLFKIIYQEPVDYGKSLILTTKTCMGITAVGYGIGALKSVGGDMEKALLQFDRTLWKSIAHQPIPWANFAAKIESAVMFKDAMTHLVGKWRLLSDTERTMLDDPVLHTCYNKWFDFQKEKQAVQVRMGGHYAMSLRKTGDQENIKRGATGNPSRSVYSNDIYGWMALAFFRHWFCQVTAEGKDFRARDGGFRFYKALSEGGSAYMTESDLGNFGMYFPMSDKARGVMENHTILMKEDMKNFVAPLLVNNTHYNKPENIQYLLSAKVNDEDCPWMATEDVEINMEDILAQVAHNPGMQNTSLGYGVESPLASKGQIQGFPPVEIEVATPSFGGHEGRGVLPAPRQIDGGIPGGPAEVTGNLNMSIPPVTGGSEETRQSDDAVCSESLLINGDDRGGGSSVQENACISSAVTTPVDAQILVNDSDAVARLSQVKPGPALFSDNEQACMQPAVSEHHNEVEISCTVGCDEVAPPSVELHVSRSSRQTNAQILRTDSIHSDGRMGSVPSDARRGSQEPAKVIPQKQAASQ